MRDKQNKKYYLIMNPGSKGGKSAARLKEIHRLLAIFGIDYAYDITSNLDNAFELSAKANMNGFDVIAAVGGDGTINRVISGFYDNDGKRLSNAKFGVVYTGTSPDFCKSYNIPLNIKEAVNVLTGENTRQIGIGRIEFENGVKYFACCANIGLGAELARRANSGIRKNFGDTAGTFLALLKTLCLYKPISVTINGQEFKHIYNISVGKTFYVASGLKIRNNLKSDDARFYILKIQRKPFGFIKKLYSGDELDLEYENKIAVSGTGEVEFDGDEGGHLPCIITQAERLEALCERKGTD